MSAGRKSTFLFAVMMALCLGLVSRNAGAVGDFPPLTEDEIRTFWKSNPGFDARSYIADVVSLRKVAFFPTRAIRQSFLKVKVPEDVIKSLTRYPHESAKFRFQVTQFADSASVLSAEKKTRLYELIRERLDDRKGELAAVYEHVKDTSFAVAAVVNGVPKRTADGFPGPHIYLLGTLKKAGANGNIVPKLLFQSKTQETTIGKMKPLTVPLASDTDLKNAADKIVTDMLVQIREEVAGPIP